MERRTSRLPLARRIVLRRAPVFALVAALGLAGACGLNISAGVEARDTWKRTYPLSTGGSLEIRNTNGRIHITPADGDTVELQAERIVKAATDEAAKAALAKFEIGETVSTKSVVIDAASPSSGLSIGLSRRADFEVRVPRWADVKLDATNGDIEASGLQGMFRAETTNGQIVGSALEGGATVQTTNGVVKLDFSKLGDAGVSCETTNGMITVTVPRDARAHISARVTNGAINTGDLQLAVTEQSRRRLDASIGGGGPSIKLETTNGAISIRGK